MTPKEALSELVSNGWFAQRADGWAYAVKPPAKRDINFFVLCIHTLSVWSVTTNGKPRVRVTTGSGTHSLMWMVEG